MFFMKLPENNLDNYPFTIYNLQSIDLFVQTIKPSEIAIGTTQSTLST